TNPLPGPIRRVCWEVLLLVLPGSRYTRLPLGADGRSALTLEARSLRELFAQGVDADKRDPNCRRCDWNARWLRLSLRCSQWSFWGTAKTLDGSLGVGESTGI